MSFIEELKRRNVFRMGIAYVLMGWLLLQAADFAIDLVGAPNWVIQVFAIAVLIGLPITLFIAWAFEITPEGIRREHEVDRSKSITSTTGRKLDRAIIVFLAVAVVLLLIDRFRDSDPGELTPVTSETPAPRVLTPAELEPAASAPEKSIAVLPLANRSANPEDAFFAEGIHDELLTQLSRISALRVISRTSVMGYAGTTKRMTDIGQELGVATLLEGGVQRAGDRVRINVQLIDAQSDEHLWAEIYDRELTADNLFDIQSDITQAIAKALQAVLTGDEQRGLDRKPTENVEAYAFYLRGKAAGKGYGRLREEIEVSISAFESAIALDPQFAEAYASLAIDWLEKFWLTDRGGDERDTAYHFLEQARALSPDSSETLTAQGYYHYWGHRDYSPAIIAFDRALALEPGNTLALRGKAYAQRRMGDHEGAIRSFQRVLELDPLDAQIPADYAYMLMHMGQFTKAREMLDRAMKLNADNGFTRLVHYLIELTGGDIDAAIKAIGPMRENAPGFLARSHLNMAIARGDYAAARQALAHSDPKQTNTALGEAHILWLENDQELLDAHLAKIEPEIVANANAHPDQERAQQDLVRLRGFQGDVQVLAEAIKTYRASLKPDVMRLVENSPELNAYITAGLYEEALEVMQQMVDEFGPWEFAVLHVSPAPQELGANPRYQAFMQQYVDWLAAVDAN